MKILWTTKTIYGEIMKRHNLLNNNQLAVKFGISASVSLNWTRGAIMEKEEHIERAAALLDDDAAWLALCLAVEREKSAILADRMRRILLAGANRVALVALVIGSACAGYSGHLYIS